MFVEEDCNASFSFLEAAGRMTVEYIERTIGLDSVDKQKLNLMGSTVLETSM
jgi:hypothetical protein